MLCRRSVHWRSGPGYDFDFEVQFFLDGVSGSPFEQLFPGQLSDPEAAAAEVAAFVDDLVMRSVAFSR